MAVNPAFSGLRLRVLAAVVFVPMILLLVEGASWGIFLLVLAVAVRCSWEYYHILAEAGYRTIRLLGSLLVLGLCSYFYFWRQGASDDLAALLMAALLLVVVWALFQGTEHYAANVFLTLGGVFFFGVLGSAPLLLFQAAGRGAEAHHLVAVLFLCIWLTDSGAYFSGRFWGRAKLAPAISPNKTRVGSIGGVIGSALPLPLGFLLPSFSTASLLGLLFVAGLGAQVGDLVESAFKRDMGIKDAPRLIPGHGGLLDRFDSYFLAFPLAYLYVDVLAVFS